MGDIKKELWDKLVSKEKGVRTARFGRRVVVSMRRRRSKRGTSVSRRKR